MFHTALGDPPGPTSPGASDPLLRVRGLRKRFGGTPALAGVDLDLWAGVLVLLGPNGAGKSTLIKILAGVYRADEGVVTVLGRPLGTEPASRAMSFIHQDLGLVGWMTVAENVALGTGYARRRGLISWRRVRDRCAGALALVADGLDPDRPVADLTRAERSVVALARALASDARIIVLDEPTASLPAAGRARLFEVLRDLRDRGHGILYVTHRLDEVGEIGDTVAVLRDGRVVGRHPAADAGAGRLAREIAGHRPAYRPCPAHPLGPVVLALDRVRAAGTEPVSLELRAGEALGVIGPSGAGPMWLGRAVVGARPVAEGRMLLDGRPFRPSSVAAATAAGLGLVAGDREEGCAPGLSVRENLRANPRVRRPSRHWIRPRRERAEALALIERLAVRPADTETPITALSGGNQQKIVIGRWLGVRRRVLVLEEPTAGVDLAAKEEIHRLLDDAVADGLAVLLLSTDAEEVVRLCRRALVVRRGEPAAELSGDALTVAGLLGAMAAEPRAPAARGGDERNGAARRSEETHGAGRRTERRRTAEPRGEKRRAGERRGEERPGMERGEPRGAQRPGDERHGEERPRDELREAQRAGEERPGGRQHGEGRR